MDESWISMEESRMGPETEGLTGGNHYLIVAL